MKEPKIKICGMKYPENIRKISALQPDYIGFIFYDKTPRFFDAEIPEIPSAIKKTGVFVDASVDFIAKKVRQHHLNAIQLHGSESADFCKSLREKSSNKDLQIIKVFSVKDEFDFERLKEYEKVVDFFLFDTKGKTKGGTGKTFNWEVLKDYPSATPFFLSGGIGIEEADQVKQLISHFRESKREKLLFAVDVNSRFEDEPGVKNAERLKEFWERIYGL